jgi:hypothetical protein
MITREKSGCLPIFLLAFFITGFISCAVNLVMTGQLSPDDSPYSEAISWLIYPNLLIAYFIYQAHKRNRKHEITNMKTKRDALTDKEIELKAKQKSVLDKLRKTI